MTGAGAVEALDELGLVDAAHKADVVTKVGEVWQAIVLARWVHRNWSTDHWH